MRRWWKRNFQKPAPAEVDQELQFHMDELVREKVAQGLSPDRARREAILEFGGSESVKEDLRDVHRLPVLDAMLAHIRHACRSLRAAPSFSLTVIATLTLGIGANTVVFSAINAVLLRPLPYPNADRLVVLHEYQSKHKNPERPVAPVRLEDWNRLNGTFQALSGYYTEDTTDSAGGRYADDPGNGAPPGKIKRAFIAPRFLSVLGISPALGHDFTAQDEHSQSNSSASVIISDRYWRAHFHSDPNTLGRPLVPAKSSAIVIGIMPPGFAFPSVDVDLWYMVPPEAPYARDRGSTWYTAIGRLKPGITEAQARANLDLVQGQLARQFPADDADLTATITALKETTVGTARASLWLLFAAVCVLLLMACTNVSALVLARGMERQREFSVRLALGASRLHIAAQVLTETLLLALCGTLSGLAIAAASARLLTAMAKSIPRIGEVGIDWNLIAYTTVCMIVVALLSGLLPARQASLSAPAGALSQGGRAQVAGRRPAQWILVSIQVALAVCLLSGSALLLRSFQALSQVSPGFDPSHVLAFRVTGSYAETADLPRLKQSVDRMLGAVRAVPGVQNVALALSIPGVPANFKSELLSPGSGLDPAVKLSAEFRAVSEDYFAATSIPVLAGKPCDRFSLGTGALVNRIFSSTYFGGKDPVGQQLIISPSSASTRPSTILGVVGDAREAGINHEPVPTVYWCQTLYNPDRVFLVRAGADPSTVAPTVRLAIQAVEPARAVYDLAPLPAHLSEAFAEVRLRTIVLTLFAATALSLAYVGLYGSMSYMVTTHRREIGLRIALGAPRSQVGMRFIVQGLCVAAAGTAVGLCLAAWSARFISAMLYGVRADDTAAFGASIITILLVALVASTVPAMRAIRVDPMNALREE